MLVLLRSQWRILISVFLLFAVFTLISMRVGAQQTIPMGVTAFPYQDSSTRLQPQSMTRISTSFYYDREANSACVDVDRRYLVEAGLSAYQLFENLTSDQYVTAWFDSKRLSFLNGEVMIYLTIPLLMTPNQQMDFNNLAGYCINLPALERGTHTFVMRIRSTTGNVSRIFWLIEVA